ncbi:MAG TPA: hypothetical protein VKF81_08440, partial [Blastocatellia bacterium]|nr:hypothetical protein [Blastocatellia bacterium]
MKPVKSNAPLLQAGAMLMLAIALIVFQLNAPTGGAQTIGIEFIFDIVPDTTPVSTALATGSTFYIQGKVYPFRTVNQADCTFRTANPRQVGTWRAWGETADDGLFVMKHSLMIDNVGGMIEIQGTTGVNLAGGGAAPAGAGSGPPFTGPTEILSVVGGAGAYRGLNGEAQVRGYCVQDPTHAFRYDR